MNKSVGIITLFHNSTNYGGVLQAYALAKILQQLNYSAKQIRYIPGEPKRTLNIKSIILRLTKKDLTIKKICTFLINSLPNKLLFHQVTKRVNLRKNNFEIFNLKYIPSTQPYTDETIISIINDFDIFISGSDQVWNPIWFYHKPYYLDFVPETRPKIAYATSVALSSLSNEQYQKMQPLISRFSSISVREKNAVTLLKGMTNNKIEWVVDPTLLLNREDWNTLALPRQINEKYIFIYLLGSNKENRKAAKRFAQNKHLLIVTTPFVGTNKIWQLWYGDIHCYGGPDTFISLIRDAEYIITDSFHACVFATLFHKKFVALKKHKDDVPHSVNERLNSLFEITRNQFCSPHEINEKIETEINYTEVDECIAKRRKQSLDWLISELKKSEHT